MWTHFSTHPQYKVALFSHFPPDFGAETYPSAALCSDWDSSCAFGCILGAIWCRCQPLQLTHLTIEECQGAHRTFPNPLPYSHAVRHTLCDKFICSSLSAGRHDWLQWSFPFLWSKLPIFCIFLQLAQKAAWFHAHRHHRPDLRLQKLIIV